MHYFWRVIQIGFNFHRVPASVQELLDVWFYRFRTRERKLAVVGIASVIWIIWKTRNDACFRDKWPNDPTNVIFVICSNIEYWSHCEPA